MAVLEVPLIYGIEGIGPRAKTSAVWGVVETVPVNVPDAVNVPVAVRAATRMWIGHTAAETAASTRIVGTIDYRGWRGSLWRPAFFQGRSTPGGDTTSSDVRVAVGRWWDNVSRPNLRQCQFMSVSNGGVAEFSRHMGPEQAAAARNVTWNGRDDALADLLVAASRDFAMLDGVLHVRTLGPVWEVSRHYGNGPVAVRGLSVQPDGSGPSINECELYPASASGMLAATGYRPIDGAAIDIVDGVLAAECCPSIETVVLAGAARLIAHSRWFGNVADLPARILEPIAAIRSMFPDSVYLDLPDSSAVEEAVRSLDSRLPVRVASEGGTALLQSPLSAHVRWLDRLREMGLAAEPRPAAAFP